MIRLQIGSDEREDDDISEDWVNQQVRRRRNDEAQVCARVTLVTESLDFALSTAGCRGGSSSRASLTRKENEIVDLWTKCGLNDPEFQGGQLIAFLKQVRRIL
ncbi:hypothetical protein [Longimicrobium terrae]|uniref:Uncharacterized protein n=1 Tax=Longimicrobium terrae TaxID=1639882 RepID=A0A841GQ25_9BACT|nr:hypothetical protein [Longimicrobium terrae]MBB4635118.1 hypothetical protein [Longimicrobium terrae]MBB6069512.1 hypothetical protein [Longimicrobium terrae]NNC31686.1 hypothetical protein [Longimicrobium terrae]